MSGGLRPSRGPATVLPMQIHVYIYVCIYIERDRHIYIYLFFLLRVYDFQKVLKLGSAGRGPDRVFCLMLGTQARPALGQTVLLGRGHPYFLASPLGLE